MIRNFSGENGQENFQEIKKKCLFVCSLGSLQGAKMFDHRKFSCVSINSTIMQQKYHCIITSLIIYKKVA